ncbi:MAG: hypothetical protein ABI551_15670 [Polyangiaceae bacterium]
MRSSGSARSVGVVAVAMHIAACSLFVDTGGLSDGDGGSSADGGAADASDASDATTDARPTNDAGGDGGDAGEGGPALRYCQAHAGHRFCLDFDDSKDVPSIGGTNYDPARFFVDDGASASPPHSLYALFSVGGSSEAINELFTSTAALSGSIDLRFDSNDLTKGQLVPLQIDYGATPGVADHYYYLQTYYGFFNFSEAVEPDDGGAASFTSNTIASPVPVGAWVHVDFAVSADGHTTVSLDGSPVLDLQGQIPLTAGVPVKIVIGAYSNDLKAAIVEHLDNIVIDL